MERTNRRRIHLAPGRFGTLGMAGSLLLLALPLVAGETPREDVSDAAETSSTIRSPFPRPRLLPGPMAPLETAADSLMAGLFRLLPGGRNLPHHLKKRGHDDYPLVFRWIPRSWTTFGWGRPALMAGNQNHWQEGSPKPIGERGTFQISRFPDLPPPLCWVPLYFAATTPGGVHVRLGARWDDVDAYVQFPSIALKRNVQQ